MQACSTYGSVSLRRGLSERAHVRHLPTAHPAPPPPSPAGNQWTTGLRGRNSDLLYWTKLEFDDNTGDVLQIVRADECQLSVA